LRQALEDARKERGLETVVERHLGRGSDDHERAVGGQAELGEHRGVGLEVRQVVLLLESGIGADLSLRAVGEEALGWDHVRHDHGTREPAVHLVLHLRPLVVERRGARNAQQARGHADVVGAVPHREVETPAARPPAQGKAA
jgi:hypothetical protein